MFGQIMRKGTFDQKFIHTTEEPVLLSMVVCMSARGRSQNQRARRKLLTSLVLSLVSGCF